MKSFHDSDVTVTLTGREWIALLKRAVQQIATLEEAEIYNITADKLQKQLLAAQDSLATLVDRVHEPAPANAVERYKGWVITLLPSTRYTWSRAAQGLSFATAEEARADIDLFVAKVDVAR